MTPSLPDIIAAAVAVAPLVAVPALTMAGAWNSTGSNRPNRFAHFFGRLQMNGRPER